MGTSGCSASGDSGQNHDAIRGSGAAQAGCDPRDRPGGIHRPRQALGREHPRTNATVTFVVSTLQEFRTGKIRGPMLALLGTVLGAVVAYAVHLAQKATGLGKGAN